MTTDRIAGSSSRAAARVRYARVRGGRAKGVRIDACAPVDQEVDYLRRSAMSGSELARYVQGGPAATDTGAATAAGTAGRWHWRGLILQSGRRQRPLLSPAVESAQSHDAAPSCESQRSQQPSDVRAPRGLGQRSARAEPRPQYRRPDQPCEPLPKHHGSHHKLNYDGSWVLHFEVNQG